jgi:hypothetical protein
MVDMASRLERYEAGYRALGARLGAVGFISPGSLVSRTTSCGKPGCHCQADPPQRHGPYFQWSRAVSGRTVSRRLSEAEAGLYREWIDNRRQLEAILEEMYDVSAAAGGILLDRVKVAARSKRR